MNHHERKFSNTHCHLICLYFTYFHITQIYIGGDYDGVEMLADDPGAPRDSSWTMNPGGTIEKKCEAEFDAMHYKGECHSAYYFSEV